MPSDPSPSDPRAGTATWTGSPDRPLIAPIELASRLGDEHLRIVDVRWVLGQPGAGRRAYDAGHIPGAIFLDLDSDLADPAGFGAPGRHPLPTPAAFATTVEAAGIGDADLVVGYDDVGGWVAARLWWMLDDLGFNARGRRGGAAVLDGGWAAWLDAGLPTSTEVARLEPAHVTLDASWTRVIDRDTLRAQLPEVILLDARAGERYRGETEPIDPVAGHIPTALSAPWAESLDPAQRLRPPEALRDRYEALGAGASPAGRVVSSCGSGVTACHHALAMRVAGLPDPTIYVGSYSDWSRSGLPVAVGPEPGEPPW